MLSPGEPAIDIDIRNVKNFFECLAGKLAEKRCVLSDVRISTLASRPLPIFPCLRSIFDCAEDFIPDRKQSLPLIEQRCGILGENLFRLGKPRQMHAGFAALDSRQMLPHFIGGEAEDGRDQAHQRLGNLPQHGLRGAARRAGGREGVHAVLEHVEIKGAQVHDGELVHRLVDAMELEGLVPAEDFFGQLAGAGQHVAVQRQQLVSPARGRARDRNRARLPSRKRKVLRSFL